MNKPKKRKVSNRKIKDPEWYVSLTADALDFKFASLAKNLGKALKPEVDDTAFELLKIYDLAFNRTLESLEIDQQVSSLKQNEKLFFESIVDPTFPSHHPVFNQLLLKLKIEFNDAEVNEGWSISRTSIRNNFASNFNRVIQTEDEKYPNASKYIRGLQIYVEPVESKLIAHVNSILDEVEYDGLPVDSQLTLRKSYVTPSFESITVKVPYHGGGKSIGENLLQSLITQIDSDTQPIIIHGQPGHGKTSSVKMLVTALAGIYQTNDQPGTILFYEFKNLRSLNSPIIHVLNAETNFINDEDIFIGRQTVLILDGLDERQITDGSDEALKGFVSGLFRLAERVNKHPETRLNLILTGRSQFVGQIQSSFNANHHIYEIQDFSPHKIELWLKRFNSQKLSTNNITIEHLRANALGELVSQPILLAISAIMLSDRQGIKLIKEIDGSKITRTRIYLIIAQWSFEKKWQKSPKFSSLNDALNFDDYFILLQAIAFEMFVAGEESIKLSKLAISLRDSVFDLDLIENFGESEIEKLCSQLRISFFFEGVEHKAFSFIHKSIKDFLIVSGMIDGLIALLSECNIKKVERISSDLYKLLSIKYLSKEDHSPMLAEWVKFRFDQLKPHTHKLISIWCRIGSGDLGIGFNTPSNAIESQRNIVHNFYEIISRYFSYQSAEENRIVFGNSRVILFNKVIGERRLPEIDSFFSSLNYNELKGLCFVNQCLSSDVEFSLSWSRIGFDRCDFTNSQFIEWQLVACEFYNCNFESAEIRHGTFDQVIFRSCNFNDVKLDLLNSQSKRESYPNALLFNNQFLGCSLEGADIGGYGFRRQVGSGKTQYLFWDCELKNAIFDNYELCTIKYSRNFNGLKY